MDDDSSDVLLVKHGTLTLRFAAVKDLVWFCRTNQLNLCRSVDLCFENSVVLMGRDVFARPESGERQEVSTRFTGTDRMSSRVSVNVEGNALLLVQDCFGVESQLELRLTELVIRRENDREMITSPLFGKGFPNSHLNIVPLTGRHSTCSPRYFTGKKCVSKQVLHL